MSGKKKPVGECAYCGRYTTLTEDHVIPKSLFSAPRPTDIPKVLACAQCNNVIKSFNDTYLRDLLVADMTTVDHPVAKEQFSKFIRANQRGQSHMAREIRWESPVEVRTHAGLITGMAYSAKIPLDRIMATMKMLVRGLYRAYTGLTLPQDVHFEVKRYYDDTDLRAVIEPLLHAGAMRVQQVGDGLVFTCVYGYAPSEPASSIWVIVFYEHAVFAITTGPQDQALVNAVESGGKPLTEVSAAASDENTPGE